jgi:hypothetical protein
MAWMERTASGYLVIEARLILARLLVNFSALSVEKRGREALARGVFHWRSRKDFCNIPV